MRSALVQAALEGDPAAKAQVLTVNAMTPLELRASVGLLPAQHHCPRLVSFAGVHEMWRNSPQT
jgi:hypothetical protein